MQKFRNSLSEIHIEEKSVQYCGKTIKKSKKKVKWHTILCTVSFMSGKKNVVHNGLTVIDTVNDDENLCAIIMVGKNRVKIRVDKDIEELKFEQCNYQSVENAFFKFKNLFSEEPGDIYSKVFNN